MSCSALRPINRYTARWPQLSLWCVAEEGRGGEGRELEQRMGGFRTPVASGMLARRAAWRLLGAVKLSKISQTGRW